MTALKDYNFPIINYQKNLSSYENGFIHGSTFKEGIKELFVIRKKLMLAKNPRLEKKLDELALEQFHETKTMNPTIAEEIEGIAAGSGLSLTDIVILNNYTDFRDIALPDEGCTTIYCKRETLSFGGQTWDMHSSAKRFLCVLEVNGDFVLSLIGCVGLMGISKKGLIIGVNNINTTDAKPGVIWPALVRHCMMAENFEELEKRLINAKVTSGHNYLIGSLENGKHYELTPNLCEEVSIPSNRDNFVSFHTNHCLGEKVSKIEDKNSLSSTTFNRYEISQKITSDIKTSKDMIAFLKSHEGHPKSICSHFENGAQDPSMTCGGAVFDFNTKKLTIWRGCEVYDQNFKQYEFNL